MRKRLWGVLCMAAGVLLLLAALGLSACNRWEDAQAGEEAAQAVEDLRQAVETAPEADSASEEAPLALDPELPVAEVDGAEYVGYLSIPALDLILPVQSGWSYPKLRRAPCRQSGSSRTEDLVIAAHNYDSHFGRLHTLAVGDAVQFTDMDGIENHYTVQKIEVHPPTDVEAVEHSGAPLVLYTCTYGGKTRVVVFCERA